MYNEIDTETSADNHPDYLKTALDTCGIAWYDNAAMEIERLAMSVQNWIRAGEPVGVPFVLIRESMELSSIAVENWSETIERELAVLGYLMKNFAESYSSTYTIEAPTIPRCARYNYHLMRDGPMSFLVTYDAMRSVLIASAKICMMDEVKPRRDYSESRGEVKLL